MTQKWPATLRRATRQEKVKKKIICTYDTRMVEESWQQKKCVQLIVNTRNIYRRHHAATKTRVAHPLP